jgi:hypothetical protein
MIGSSNLARIDLDVHPDIQVECYPGAALSHFRTMAMRHQDGPSPEKIILNIGINSKNEHPTKASSHLRFMAREFKNTFPNAELHFAEINFSDSLSDRQRYCLKRINESARSNCHVDKVIPKISDANFHVEKDRIHWTKETANCIYNHWLTVLSLN